MSSRQEEKERRRRERLAQEEAAARRAARARRIQLIGGAVLAAAVVAVVVVAVTSSGGGDGGASRAAAEGAKPPPVQQRNLQEAARAAGCTVRELRAEGQGHVSEDVTYRSNPPTSGEHDPQPAEDGIYSRENPPDIEQSVHSLEHGRILFQYRPGTPQTRIEQLENMASEDVKGTSLYKSLVFENPTKMPFAVAATAWTRSIGCRTFGDAAFDALRAFRVQYVDKAPEFVP